MIESNFDKMLLKVYSDRLEKLERPIIKGHEGSKTYSDLFDLLDEDGYLHEGERELLMSKLFMTMVGELGMA